MKNRSLFRGLLLAASAALLGACQMTTFETAPIAAAPCDAALAGQWLSLDDDPAKNGELVLRVDGNCQLVVDMKNNESVRTSPATPLHLGQHGLYRYAWVDARWALAQFEEDHAPHEGDVYLLRIAHDRDRLTLWTTNDKAVAHAIIDGDLQGEVVARDHDLFNRLAANAAPEVLDHAGLFNADPVQFIRQAEPAK